MFPLKNVARKGLDVLHKDIRKGYIDLCLIDCISIFQD